MSVQSSPNTPFTIMNAWMAPGYPEGLKELRAHSETQFDPGMVGAFIQFWNDGLNRKSNIKS